MDRNRHNRRARGVASLVASLGVAVLLTACGGKSSGGGPGIYLSTTTLQTAEGGPDVTFEVRLNSPPTGWVSLDVCTSDTSEGMLREVGDFFDSSCVFLDFDATNWMTPQVLTVVPKNDTASDGNQTYEITASVWGSADMNYASVPARAITVTNADDDVPGVTISKATASTSEAATTDTFTVRLNTPPSATVTIPVTSTDTTEGLLRGGSSPATSVPSINLTFTTGNWSTPQTVTIYGQGDLIDDGNQTYSVTVGAPTGAPEYAALLQQTVAVTNLDDDTAGITVAAGANPLVTSENGTTATFTVRLNTEPTADVTVDVTSGNPDEGLLSAGIENLVDVVHLTFTSANWATPQVVTVTGQDEVGPPTPSDNVSYDVTVGPATGDAVYASLATQAVAVLNTDNDTAAVLVPAVATGIQTSESGATNTATFTVVLNKQPTVDVVVPITVSDVTEGLVKGGSSPTIPASTIDLTFTAADFSTPQTVTVVGQADNLVDGSQTYTITVGSPTGDALYTGIGSQAITVNNADTDVPGFTLSRSTTTTTEGGAVATFTVVLNRAPTADVVLPVWSSDTAEAKVSGGDSGGLYVGSLNVTFTQANWQTPQTISVQGQLDWIADTNKTYTITVGPTSSASTPYDGLALKTFNYTNYNVDTAGFTVTPTSGLATTEAGGTATFTVKLNSIPSGTVTIPVSPNPSSEALISNDGVTKVNFLSLTFAPNEWNTPKTITVHGVDDVVLDGTKSFTVSVGPTASGDASYNNLAARTVTGNNADDEVGANEGTVGAPIALTAGVARPSQVGPSGSSESYYVVSGLTPGYTFTVNVSSVTTSVVVKADADTNFASGTLCTATVVTPSSGSCRAIVPGSGTVYLQATTTSTAGAGYTLTVTEDAVWYSSDVPKSLVAYGSATSVATVAAGPTSITKVTVQVNVSHTWVGDLGLFLMSPGGTEIRLSDYNGGNGDHYVDTVFDDAAATSITAGVAPFTGVYRPEVPLTGFNGQNANGTWTLRVYNNWSIAGTINSWSVTID